MQAREQLSAADRERKILDHHPLVRMIATRMVRRFPSHIEVEELINIGMLGLIDAIDRFEPGRGVPFKAYAEIRIRGAIVDALREADWIPRSVRRRFARIDTARTSLRAQLGREPTREEMATTLELSVEEYDDLCGGAEIRKLVSLDAPVDEDGGTTLVEQVAPAETDSALDLWMAEEARVAAHSAVQNLPDKERQVVSLYYQRGLNLKEIGEILGVTESRVCQLRGQAVKRLQKKLADLRSA
ncbi:MAG: sigma-70 family RNA polymerase sigma factor [Myxococcota bacterium]